jgi:hypothetical protein
MTTFLWMLYLAFTLLVTLKTIHFIICFTIDLRETYNEYELIASYGLITSCLLWSIWYFYFLH